MSRILVTIFSDASFHLPTKRGGYGYWIKSSMATDKGSGGLDDVDSAAHAELWGISKAVERARELHQGQDLDFVIQCDSMRALGVILTVVKTAKVAKTSPLPIQKSAKLKKGEAAIINNLGAGKSRIWLKHVKGHTDHVDSRSALNRLCDKIAGIASRSNSNLSAA